VWRRPVEAATGADLSHVRIDAATSPSHVAGGTHTVGAFHNDTVYPGPAGTRPHSNLDRDILLHELVHAAQAHAADLTGHAAHFHGHGALRKEGNQPDQSEWSVAWSGSGRVYRYMTESEKTAATRVFGSALNTDEVELSVHPIVSIGGYARTIHNTIYFPSDSLTGDYMPWLIHELTHVWQYQQGAGVVGMAWEAVVARYDYRDEAGLREAWEQGQAFDEFTTEQQGNILEDYYLALRDNRDTSAFDGFVDQVRTGREKEHRYRTVEPLPAGKLDWVKTNRDYAAETETKIEQELRLQIQSGNVVALAGRKRRLLWYFYDLSGYMSKAYLERINERRSDDEMVRLMYERISSETRAELVEALRGRRPSGERPRM
jgi:hypothetical protein